MKKMIDDSRLAYSPIEAAALLGCGRSLIYELCARKDFPTIRIGTGRKILIPADALRVWVNDQTDGAQVM